MIPTDCSALRAPTILPGYNRETLLSCIRILVVLRPTSCSYRGVQETHLSTYVKAGRGEWLFALES